jgi:A/G-specific adenine glycosylase
VVGQHNGASHGEGRLSRSRVRWFRAQLLGWGSTNRRTFFWRYEQLSLYEVLVVEVLLARTRAVAVEPVARSFLKSYPSADSLAQARLADAESLLRPLGLFRKRAAALIATANAVIDRFGGAIPKELGKLLELPYVGRYAANAILCFGLERNAAVVDANVIRVLSRFFDLPRPAGKAELAEDYWLLAERLLSSEQPREFNWSLLDLGALVCTARGPKCGDCPLSLHCASAHGI